MEIKREVKTIRVEQECEQCYSDTMRPTGETLMTHPPKYPHSCNNCGNREVYIAVYPYIEYE